MDPTTAAAITALGATSGGGIITAIIIILLALSPLIVKVWNWSKETSAQGILYSQLSELVQNQRKELDGMYKERIEMQNTLFELKSKVEKLEESEKLVDILKKKLEQKDKIIAERDNRIASLLEELLKMKDRVHNLELRLKADESQWCENCQYKNTQYISRISNE